MVSTHQNQTSVFIHLTLAVVSAICALVLSPVNAFAATAVSGSISTNTTWTTANRSVCH